MNPRLAIVSALLLIPCTLFLAGADASDSGRGLSLPTFTKENYRDTWLRVDTVRAISPTEFDATGVRLTKYKRNPTDDVDTEITTPTANVQTDREILRGDSTVNVVRADHGLEISGEQWSYDQNTNTVVIGKNTRIVLRANLPDLLQ
jgi:hypothetical protein